MYELMVQERTHRYMEAAVRYVRIAGRAFVPHFASPAHQMVPAGSRRPTGGIAGRWRPVLQIMTPAAYGTGPHYDSSVSRKATMTTPTNEPTLYARLGG